MGREEAFGLLNELAPEALRVAAAGFAAESGMMKIEILNTSLRLVAAPSTRSERTLALHAYVLDLCAADVAFDVRDRARFVKQLSAALTSEAAAPGDSTGQAATQVILRPQFQAQASQGVLQKRTDFVIGTLSRVVDHRAPGYTELPRFASADSDPALREPLVEEQPEAGAARGGQGRRAQEGGGLGHINDFYSSGSDSDSASYSGSYSSGYDSDGSGSGFYSDGSGSYSYSDSGSDSDGEGEAPA